MQLRDVRLPAGLDASRVFLTSCSWRVSRWRQAEHWFQRAIALSPKHAKAMMYYGLPPRSCRFTGKRFQFKTFWQ